MQYTIAEKSFDHSDYAGFWVRVAAACLDMVLYMPFYYGFKSISGEAYHWWAEAGFIAFALLTYSLFFASPLKGSPGMWLLRFHICDTSGNPISFTRAFMWGITGAIGWSLCFIGVIYLQSRFDIFAVNDLMKSCQEQNIALDDCAQEIQTMINIPFENFIQLCYASLGMAFFLSLIWALSIALPKDKTGFHNLICGTRFIKGRG